MASILGSITLLAKAAIAQIKGQYRVAIATSNKAILLDDRNYLAYEIRGQARNGLGDYEGAIEDLSHCRLLITK